MSSILIKGMKMPKKCCDCDLLPAEIDWDEQWECPITEEIVHKYVEEREGKPSDCPLVEIPPHGDLIEREELLAELELERNACNDDTEFANKIVPNCIKGAPTVIESEEE